MNAPNAPVNELPVHQHPLYARVEAALDSIRGYLNTDGGDVRIHAITPDMVVQVQLLGACNSCSMSEMTMKAGLEQAVMRAVPEIKAVQAAPLH